MFSRVSIGLKKNHGITMNIQSQSHLAWCAGRAVLDTGHIVGVALVLQPLLPVPVSPIRAPTQRLTPATLQFLTCPRLQSIVVMFIIVVVVAEQTRVAVRVGVAGGQGLEDDGGLVGDHLLLHAHPVVFVNSLPPRNYKQRLYYLSYNF